MIEMPRRSVTRFFIPLIDVLTLMFCIYLLMPIVESPQRAAETGPGAKESSANLERLTAADRQELDRLRKEQRRLLDEVELLRRLKVEAPTPLLFVRVLETGEKGQLSFYEPRTRERFQLSAENVAEFVRKQREQAAEKDLYFLILIPRVGSSLPRYPLQTQMEQYDRWFEGIPHSYSYYPLQGQLH
jgi:hypothetical protein